MQDYIRKYINCVDNYNNAVSQILTETVHVQYEVEEKLPEIVNTNEAILEELNELKFKLESMDCDSNDINIREGFMTAIFKSCELIENLITTKYIRGINE